MLYIEALNEGMRIAGVYLCKQKTAAVTKNGKPYDNVILMDKTGQIDAKIWDPDGPGIDDFEALDYVDIVGDVSRYNGALQLSVKRVRKAREGEYNPADYLPVTDKDEEQMMKQLYAFIEEVKEPHLYALLQHFFREDEALVRCFRNSSAAKSIHHSFVGGLLEHTISVTRLCWFFSRAYPILSKDLLLTAAMLHDIGKTRELSAFPQNDYTDDGQMLGHIMIGAEMIHDACREIEGFPPRLETELKHCILAHHGEYEYGSPKKPAIAEALALNLADNTDAKLESMTELLRGAAQKREGEWLGFSKIFESNIRKTDTQKETRQ